MVQPVNSTPSFLSSNAQDFIEEGVGRLTCRKDWNS